MLLTGGSQGFVKKGIVIINPSYYFPPIFLKFYRYDRDNLWLRLLDTSLKIFREFVVTDLMLFPEWVHIDGKSCKPVRFEGVMGFNAMRVPLWVSLSQDILERKDAGVLIKRMKLLADIMLKDSKRLCSKVSTNYGSCRTFLSVSLLPFNRSLKSYIDTGALHRNYYLLSLLMFASLGISLNDISEAPDVF